MTTNWLKDCEICNAGFCAEMGNLIDERNLSEHRAAQHLARSAERKLGFPLFTGKQLRDRFRYHKNKDKKRVYSAEDYSQDELEAVASGGEVAEIPPKPKRKQEPKDTKTYEEFREAWKDLRKIIHSLRRQQWEGVERHEVLQDLSALLNLAAQE